MKSKDERGEDARLIASTTDLIESDSDANSSRIALELSSRLGRGSD